MGFRFITEDLNPYRLLSMELQCFIHDAVNFRRCLERALEGWLYRKINVLSIVNKADSDGCENPSRVFVG